jgi:hypothetical protein
LKNRYSRAIERVEVTAEMRDRIMKNIGEAETGIQSKAPFRAYRRYISIAACLLLLLAGAFMIINSINPPVVVRPGIQECGSLGELSDAAGFKVREVKAIPFDVEQTVYTAITGELTIAQAEYTGKANELTFRMSPGSEDNSGDYNEYVDIKTSSAGGLAVTLKGNGGLYNLAVWEDGGYSYSINISNGVSEEEMLDAVLSVQ